jgi:hypothetical protein
MIAANSGAITAGQSIEKLQTTGGIENNDITDIGTLVMSLRADIKHIKTQLQSLPPFPAGKNENSNKV